MDLGPMRVMLGWGESRCWDVPFHTANITFDTRLAAACLTKPLSVCYLCSYSQMHSSSSTAESGALNATHSTSGAREN